MRLPKKHNRPKTVTNNLLKQKTYVIKMCSRLFNVNISIDIVDIQEKVYKAKTCIF